MGSGQDVQRGNDELKKPCSEVREGGGEAKSHLRQNMRVDMWDIEYVRLNKMEGMKITRVMERRRAEWEDIVEEQWMKLAHVLLRETVWGMMHSPLQLHQESRIKQGRLEMAIQSGGVKWEKTIADNTKPKQAMG